MLPVREQRQSDARASSALKNSSLIIDAGPTRNVRGKQNEWRQNAVARRRRLKRNVGDRPMRNGRRRKDKLNNSAKQSGNEKRRSARELKVSAKLDLPT